MRITEKLVNSPEEEGVTLEYIRLTKDFEEIKEYVQHKGDTLTGYRQTKEKVSVRIEDILYFETVDSLVFAYTVDCVYEIKGRHDDSSGHVAEGHRACSSGNCNVCRDLSYYGGQCFRNSLYCDTNFYSSL